jgi:hypothetical protein
VLAKTISLAGTVAFPFRLFLGITKIGVTKGEYERGNSCPFLPLPHIDAIRNMKHLLCISAILLSAVLQASAADKGIADYFRELPQQEFTERSPANLMESGLNRLESVSFGKYASIRYPLLTKVYMLLPPSLASGASVGPP